MISDPAMAQSSGVCLLMLRSRYLQGNQLTGAIPTELGLTSLVLVRPFVSSPAVRQSSEFADAMLRYLQANQRMGAIPTELGLLTSLTEL